MCTLTWLQTETGYQIFFNRDEQRTRLPALPPECVTHHGVKILTPLDPVGQGSWISSNEYGLSLCLLNYYQGKAPDTTLISRGQLLRNLSHSAHLNVLDEQVITMTLSSYAPFTLIAFARRSESNLFPHSVTGYQWDGSSLKRFSPNKFITSSSVNFEEVAHIRKHKYLNLLDTASSQKLSDFHSTHDGEKNYKSVCMHRKDATTVSFSHIEVTPDLTTFDYINGSPCKADSSDRFRAQLDNQKK